MSRNMILTDFPINKEWSLLTVLREETKIEWEGHYMDGCMNVSKVRRIANYLFFPLYLFVRYKAHYIVAWQQFYGLFYAFYSRLLTPPCWRKQRLYILTFIYKKKKGLIGFVYYRVMNFILGNGIIKKVAVYSQSEVEYYSSIFPKARGKFVAFKYAIDYLPEIETISTLQEEEYIFATGRSNRDYPFLVDMLNDTDYKVKIACNGLSINHSNNIEILHNVFREKMFKYMANSYIVVIPLSDMSISSGQLVILQAMQLGKPIIVTNNTTVYDYVDDGRTGYIVEKDKTKWMEKIELLYRDKSIYEAISAAEKEEFSNKFSVEIFHRNATRMVAQDLQ